MTKPKVSSGHGDCQSRKLTDRQRATLRKKGEVQITVIGFPKTVRRTNVRNGCIEWYHRSDRHGEPAIRDYGRDSKTTARYRPSRVKGRRFEGDFGKRS